MAHFFADRPVFAWVVAMLVGLAGVLSIAVLPIAQYPSVAPPSVNIQVVYPGASAALMDESITSLVEQELNGAEGLLYVESQSQASRATIVASFKPGTNPDLAAVDVQNRIKRVEARLPAAARQQGIQVTKASSSFLLVATLLSTDGKRDRIELGDYIYRNVINDIRRIPGVGEARVFGTERAMRIWINPEALVARNLTAGDVLAAVRGQNAQISAGALGEQPSDPAQQIATTLVATGQLETPEEFADIVLRDNPDGSAVRLRDVAKVELGGQMYSFDSVYNGQPSAAFAVQLTPTGNALETANLVKAKLAELSEYFPEGVTYQLPVDNSEFIAISIKEVVYTLLEAVVLVFLVMFLFLQNVRATIIPTIVVPIALLGAFATMNAFGFSINVLTMFGLVLAIGIVVDDAIVVVENVERIMSEEGLSPREATHKAMGQITSAIIGITLVLCAVFVPMAFFGGAVGKIYQQFSLSMVSSIVFSALMALSLTPALCATMLKPMAHHQDANAKGPLARFNRWFASLTHGYAGWTGRWVGRRGRAMALYGVIVAVLGLLYVRMPTAFLPMEDQGALISIVSLPPGASAIRTNAVMAEIDEYFLKQPGVQRLMSIRGFSFNGMAPNAGIAFVKLKPWGERDENLSAPNIANRANAALRKIRDASVFTVTPPPIRELGNSSGFAFRLQDRGAVGHEALNAARNQLLAAANSSPILRNVRPEGLDDSPQIEVQIDRHKMSALGVSFPVVSETLATSLGSAYANDFPNAGRQQQVLLQVDAQHRAQPEDIGAIYVRNSSGRLVALSEITTAKWITGPVQVTRYNGYPAMKITGEAAPGRSTGEAMAEMERLTAALGPAFGYEWTGTSLEEQTSGAQVPALLTLSLLVVFLCLAALYESWAIPFSVLLVVPLGIFGSVLGSTFTGMANDVYFRIGLIAIMGLSAKNAILIVEFARDLEERGMDLVAATLEACRLRFRPIIMTSLAFTLGVTPLATASGAGSAGQRAIGTAVLGGMIAATVLAVFLVPVFFVVVRSLFSRRSRPVTAQEQSSHG